VTDEEEPRRHEEHEEKHEDEFENEFLRVSLRDLHVFVAVWLEGMRYKNKSGPKGSHLFRPAVH
jgi:hypothetical protein